MDYKAIVNKANKYHYYVVTTNKTVCISLSNKKSEAKKLALEKLKPNINNLIGKKLIVVKIKSVAKAFEKQKTSDELKIIGGPIILEFERGLIKSPSKITNFDDKLNNKIYLSNKYIKKYKDNIVFDLKKLVSNFVTDKFNQGLLAMTIL
jgi:hypothetical protein